jgi:hypothetical protein
MVVARLRLSPEDLPELEVLFLVNVLYGENI